MTAATQPSLTELRAGHFPPPSGYRTKTKPYDHQLVVLEHIVRLPNCAVLSEQGTGKTKSIIDFMDYMIDQGTALRALVVCPASLIDNVWTGEIELHSRCLGQSIHRLNKPPKQRLKILDRWEPGVYLVSYETVRSMAKKNSLAGYPWDLVVADEMSKIKSPKSAVSRAMWQFSDKCDARRVGATGTVSAQSPLDIWSQYRFLDHRIFGGSYFEFRARYAQLKMQRFGNMRPFQQVVGYKNLDDLAERQFAIGVRYRKEECLDLPEQVFVTETLSWNDVAARDAYVEMRNDLVSEINGKEIAASGVLSKINKLRQMCSGWVYDETGKVELLGKKPRTAKHHRLIELLEETDDQVIVWTDFVHDNNDVHKVLEDTGFTACKVNGSTAGMDRTRRIDAFKAGEFKVLVAQRSCLQMGVTLINATTMVNYTPTWSVEEHLQSMARNHRAGQKNRTLVINFEMEESIECAMHKALKARINLADMVNNFDLTWL